MKWCQKMFCSILLSGLIQRPIYSIRRTKEAFWVGGRSVFQLLSTASWLFTGPLWILLGGHSFPRTLCLQEWRLISVALQLFDPFNWRCFRGIRTSVMRKAWGRDEQIHQHGRGDSCSAAVLRRHPSKDQSRLRCSSTGEIKNSLTPSSTGTHLISWEDVMQSTRPFMLQILLQFQQKEPLIMDLEGCGAEVSHPLNPEEGSHL